MALIVLATALCLAGVVALYAREEIVSPKGFSGHAVQALERQEVRRVVAREIVVQLIDQGSTNLISARPILESVVEGVIRSDPFERLFRAAAGQANRLLFVREGGNVAFDLADAGTVVISAVRSVAPDVAREIPPDADARLVTLRKRKFATGTLRFADNVRVLGLVLPALAIVVYGMAVGVAPERRTAITRTALAIGAAAAMLAIGLLVLKAYVVAHVYGSEELTNEDVRHATGGIWDAFLGGLTAWALGVGALALLVAAASASLLRPFTAERGFDRLRALAAAPKRPGLRTARGVLLLALGAFIVLEPTLALQVIAVTAGGLLVYYGTGEAVSGVYSPERREAGGPARRRAWALAGAAGAAVTVGITIAVALGGPGQPEPSAAAVRTCNGYVELCGRRLDQVVFAGTHNSMSAADTPGWLLVNQRRTIGRQLQDGIRLFLIDPHYGVEDSRGGVRTDFKAERSGLNRVASKLSPQALSAVQRLGGRLGPGDLRGGKRDVWLCHTVCELGATRMRDALETIRLFLERNRGEVVIIFDEDYVSERDLERVYREPGLLPYLATLDRLEPLPTLRQLIDSNKRVIVFTERTPSGEYAWNMDGFAWVQDTPLRATRPGQLSCAFSRGESGSPLLMLNNWIDRFPPPLEASRAVLRRDFVLRRARRCRRRRGLVPNLIAADFYDQGDLVGAVRRLNGLGERRAARTEPPYDVAAPARG